MKLQPQSPVAGRYVQGMGVSLFSDSPDFFHCNGWIHITIMPADLAYRGHSGSQLLPWNLFLEILLSVLERICWCNCGSWLAAAGFENSLVLLDVTSYELEVLLGSEYSFMLTTTRMTAVLILLPTCPQTIATISLVSIMYQMLC